MEKRENARCPECDADLTADDIAYVPVTRQIIAFVCVECDQIIGFSG